MSTSSSVVQAASSFILGPPSNTLTDDQVANGDEYRTKARNKVLDTIESSKKYIQTIKNSNVGINEADTTPLTSYLQAELTWWNTNPELSPRQVRARWIIYMETYQSIMQTLQTTVNTKTRKTYDALKTEKEKAAFVEKLEDPDQKQFLETTNTSTEQTKEQMLAQATQATLQAAQTKTVFTDASSAISDAINIVYKIVYTVFCIRIGSLCANYYIYRPPAYRILAFVYGGIFAPIIGIYYVWKTISHYIFKTSLPPDFAFLPFKGYEVPIGDAKPTFNQRLFGYKMTDECKLWVSKMSEIEQSSRFDALTKVDRQMVGLE